MALPPRPMGSLVDSGIDPVDTAGLPELEVMIDAPEEFEGGAEVIDDGEGWRVIIGQGSGMERRLRELDKSKAASAVAEREEAKDRIAQITLRSCEPPDRLRRRHHSVSGSTARSAPSWSSLVRRKEEYWPSRTRTSSAILTRPSARTARRLRGRLLP